MTGVRATLLTRNQRRTARAGAFLSGHLAIGGNALPYVAFDPSARDALSAMPLGSTATFGLRQTERSAVVESIRP